MSATNATFDDPEAEDPFDWSIDEVIHQFCNTHRPIWSPDKPSHLPNPDLLRNAFRENDVDGESLLALDNEVLKHDIGINSFGQRRAILKAVNFLRNRSGKYQHSIFQADALTRMNPGHFATPQMANSHLLGLAQSPAFSSLGHHALAQPRSSFGSPSFGDRTAFPRAATPLGQPTISILQTAGTPRAGNAFYLPGPDLSNTATALLHNAVDPQPTTNFQLHGTNVARNVAKGISFHLQQHEEDAQNNEKSYLSDETTFLSTASRLPPDTSNIDSHRPPKATIVGGNSPLDALEAGADKSLQKENAREDASKQHAYQLGLATSNPTSNVVKARKKLAPTFVAHITTERTAANRFAKLGDTPPQLCYLDGRAQSIRDVLFPTDIDEDRSLSLPFAHMPSGRRQYVASLVKNALRQPVRPLPGSGAKYKMLSTKSSLSLDDPKYFIMFAPGLNPTVRNVEDWPKLKASQTVPSKRGRRSTTFRKPDGETIPPNDPFQVAEISEVDGSELEYLLQKYPANPVDEDEGYPQYGESGDENEYDEETWEEMQNEIEEQKRDKGTGIMDRRQIELAIDEATEDLKSFWRNTKLPKVQEKAYRLWKKAAADKRRQTEIDQKLFWVKRFDATIQKMRDAILKDIWHKPAEVKHQCQSLEESVFQREESLYFIQVLTATRAPIRPASAALLQARSKDRPQMPDGEEFLASDSDTSFTSFIDDDVSDAHSIPHDAPNPEVEASLAQLREAAARARPEKPSVAPELERSPSHEDEVGQDRSPDLGLLSDDNAGGFPDLHTPSPIDDDSDEDMIVSSADRRKWSSKSRKHDFGSGFNVPPNPEEETSSLDEADDNASQSSDLDLPHLPRTQYRDHGRSKLQAIDLTFSSSPSRGEQTDHESTSDFEVQSVQTPDLNPTDEPAEPVLKLKLGTSIARFSSTDTSGSSPRVVLTQPSDDSGLPGLEDVAKMQELDWDDVIARSDRRRALAKAVYDLDLNMAKMLTKYIKSMATDPDRPLDRLRMALVDIDHAKGMDLKSPLIQNLALLFVSFICHANMMDISMVPPADINDAYEALNGASHQFFDCLRRTLDAYCGFIPPLKLLHKKRKVGDPNLNDELADESNISEQTTDSEHVQHAEEPSSHKKRKREVKESQEAKFQQLNDQLRVQEEEKRKADIVAKKLLAMGTTGADPFHHVVNTIEPYIYLDPHVGQRVKPHQVDGISFMWREIVRDPKRQGCLLAHTMGLGKTMQVISLLSTIAQAGRSPDPAIRRQVPKELRHIRALVLCPPTLVENWHDELIMWTPDQAVLGKVRKLANTTRPQRLLMIRKWAANGGVLLVSYEMFRSLLANKGKTAYGEDDFRELQENLLNVPNIIVADEAHKMKNATSQIAMVAKRFKSNSRIALTGSPLNNHLEEYHTMVDWIAPGYLGNIVQFKSKYSEPINEGLYLDSSSYERRVSLRKLHVLKRDLDPKISRADISAIEKDMSSKTEFFITIPLTDLQAEAYDILIDHVLGGKSRTSNAQLWSWMAILILLCNHPSCFVRKIESEQENILPRPTTKAKTTSDDDDDASVVAPDDVPLSDLEGLSDVRSRAIEVFRNEDLKDLAGNVGLSNRSLIVKQIVEESRGIGDKVLIFSHSIPTLDYLEDLMSEIGCPYSRIDGKTSMGKRQEATKIFNVAGQGPEVFLISMRAGGLGLNLQGANRVIIYDFSWNPSWEEQAIGRAYRLGQKKPVFVYRFRAGGTFEDVLYNKSVFKTQLFQRVVDKKNYMGRASKSVVDYLFRSREVPQKDFEASLGKDPKVLDRIINRTKCIRNIELTETFQKEEDEDLTPEERRAADEEYQDQVLERNDPEAYRLKKQQQQYALLLSQQPLNHTVATAGNILNVMSENRPQGRAAGSAKQFPPQMPQMQYPVGSMFGPDPVTLTSANVSMLDQQVGSVGTVDDVQIGGMEMSNAPLRAGSVSGAIPQTDGADDKSDDSPDDIEQQLQRRTVASKDECKTQ